MASGLHSPVEDIVGRDLELGRLEHLLAEGGSLVIAGEAGIGKTTLWRAGVELARARGARVLASAPAEAEQSFSHAVLGDLLASVDEDVLRGLPGLQRRALERVLLRSDEGATDVRTVGVAFNSALAALAREGQVLIAVDDLQWVDPDSAAVLDFALRRSTSAACLFARREGAARALGRPADELVVGPLSLGAIHHLLVERLGVALPRPALLRLHRSSGGNPFYALELARGVEAGGELVIPPTLDGIAAGRIRSLPDATRRALAELSLTGRAPVGADLDAAVAAGVVEARGDEPAFTHPLLAEAAVAVLSAEQRRALHREIARNADDPELRARHLAKAATAADAGIADELARAAAEAPGHLAAAELWELAARLTPDEQPLLIAARRTEAGLAHLFSGDTSRAAELLEENVERLSPGTLQQRARVHLAVTVGKERGRAVEVLEQALLEATEPAVRLEFVNLLCTHLAFRDGSARAAEVARAFVEEAEAFGDQALLASALANAAVFELACDRPAWDLIDRLTASRQDVIPLAARHALFFALARDGRWDEARASLEEALADPDLHTIYRYQSLVANLMPIELAVGNWERALEVADEVEALAEQLELAGAVSIARSGKATVLSLLGDHEQGRALATQALEIAARQGTTLLANHARCALGLIELSCGRPREAAAIYEQVQGDGWSRQLVWVGGRATLDAVEAFAAIAEVEKARELAAFLPEDARERPAAEGCIAAADGGLERAIELLLAAPPATSKFREARELLLLGRFMRQARRRSAARETLTAARDAFKALGVPLWVERASEELRRLGGRRPPGTDLTPSERRVAELVADGLSNKEVATRLVITVRTVEAHLSKIYAKLGLTSRTALAATWRQRSSE